MTSVMRYAIYYSASETSLLTRLGARWLGRDAFDGKSLQQQMVDGLTPERVAAATTAARRYGFHATLKPPFALVRGETEARLLAAVGTLASELQPLVLPGLRVARIGGFVALVPSGSERQVGELAAKVVQGLDRFRAPTEPAELARRRMARLTPRQDELLLRWGYPYVLDEFRFHMTLTDAVDDDEAAKLMAAAEHFFAPVIGKPVTIEALTVFTEPTPAAPFLVRAVAPLGHPGKVRLLHAETPAG